MAGSYLFLKIKANASIPMPVTADIINIKVNAVSAVSFSAIISPSPISVGILYFAPYKEPIKRCDV